jgi:hypothetical protein
MVEVCILTIFLFVLLPVATHGHFTSILNRRNRIRGGSVIGDA